MSVMAITYYPIDSDDSFAVASRCQKLLAEMAEIVKVWNSTFCLPRRIDNNQLEAGSRRHYHKNGALFIGVPIFAHLGVD